MASEFGIYQSQVSVTQKKSMRTFNVVAVWRLFTVSLMVTNYHTSKVCFTWLTLQGKHA